MAKTKKAIESDTQEQDTSFSVNQFLDETKQELTKVVWPSRPQVISESAAVVLMVTLVATVVYAVDHLFVWVAGKVF